MTNKVFVVAKKWDEKLEKQTYYIAGEFTDGINARLFQEAYWNRYHEDAKVVDEQYILRNLYGRTA